MITVVCFQAVAFVNRPKGNGRFFGKYEHKQVIRNGKTLLCRAIISAGWESLSPILSSRGSGFQCWHLVGKNQGKFARNSRKIRRIARTLALAQMRNRRRIDYKKSQGISQQTKGSAMAVNQWMRIGAANRSEERRMA